jgi:predicted DNA-binding protein (MmcQ/YjbR family)
MPASPLLRLRKLCLALPEAHEVEAWGEPTFRVRNKIFAMYANASNHHGRGRHATWVKAAPGDQTAMVAAAPDCFFVPPYVGPSGWIGIWLDGVVDWDDVAEFLRDSYRLVAPKKLCALLDSNEPAEDHRAKPLGSETAKTRTQPRRKANR